jgi:hypothetical protein
MDNGWGVTGVSQSGLIAEKVLIQAVVDGGIGSQTELYTLPI